VGYAEDFSGGTIKVIGTLEVLAAVGLTLPVGVLLGHRNSYLDKMDVGAMTELIDAALDQIDVPDDSNAAAVEAGHRPLLDTDDEW